MYNQKLPANLIVDPKTTDANYPKWEELYVNVIEGAFCSGDEKHMMRAVAAACHLDDTKVLEENDIFLLPVQSTKGWQKRFWDAHVSQPEMIATGSQSERALAAAVSVAEQMPDKKVIVMFYDGETPDTLYADIKAKDGMLTALMMVDGKISCDVKGRDEAFSLFEIVNAYSVPAKTSGLSAKLKDTHANVINLAETTWNHCGATYLSKDGNLAYPVSDALEKYSQDYIDREAIQRGHDPVHTPVAP